MAYHQDIQQWMDWIENAIIFRVVDDDPKRTVFGLTLPHTREIAVTRLEGVAAPNVAVDERGSCGSPREGGRFHVFFRLA